MARGEQVETTMTWSTISGLIAPFIQFFLLGFWSWMAWSVHQERKKIRVDRVIALLRGAQDKSFMALLDAFFALQKNDTITLNFGQEEYTFKRIK